MVVHSPHEKLPALQRRVLNLDTNLARETSALAAGRLDLNRRGDILLVGGQSTLLAYDVVHEREIFRVDMSDGVSALLIARLTPELLAPVASGGSEAAAAARVGVIEGGVEGAGADPTSVMIAIVGGHGAIAGVDADGTEVFWSVSGDRVSAMTMLDGGGAAAAAGAGGGGAAAATTTGGGGGVSAGTSSGTRELLVGSDDFEIRLFRGEEVVSETTETARPTLLSPLPGGAFAYALDNGTVGVYSAAGGERLWRVKSRCEATALVLDEVRPDGTRGLIVGWADGKLEMLSLSTGALLWQTELSAEVAAVLSVDYRSEGKVALVACATDGTVRGYLRASASGGRGEGAPTAGLAAGLAATQAAAAQAEAHMAAAEDARLRSDFGAMRDAYIRLHSTNGELIAQHRKRMVEQSTRGGGGAGLGAGAFE